MGTEIYTFDQHPLLQTSGNQWEEDPKSKLEGGRLSGMRWRQDSEW